MSLFYRNCKIPWKLIWSDRMGITHMAKKDDETVHTNMMIVTHCIQVVLVYLASKKRTGQYIPLIGRQYA